MAEPPIRRPVRTAALVAVVFIAAGVIALAAALPRTIEWMAVRALDTMGIGPVVLTVEEAGWRRFRVSNISIGDTEPLTLSDLTVEYSVSGLLARRLERIRVTGLQLNARMTENGLSLGPINPLLEGERGGHPWTVETVQVRESRIGLATSVGDIVTSLEGNAESQGGGRYRGVLHLAGSAKMPEWAPEPAQLTGRVSFDVSPESIAMLRAELKAVDPPLPLVRARQADFAVSMDDRGFTLRGTIVADQGRIELKGDGPALSGPLAQYAGKGTIGVNLARLAVPGVAQDLSVTANLAVAYGGEVLDVRSMAPLTASVSGLSGKTVPASLHPWLKEPITLRVEGLALRGGTEEKGFQLSGQTEFAVATHDKQSVKGRIAGSFLTNALGQISLGQPVRIDAAYAAPALSLPGARLTTPRLSLAGNLGISADRLALALDAPMELWTKEIAIVAGSIILRNFRARVSRDDGDLFALTLTDGIPGSVRFGAQVTVPEFETEAAGMTARTVVPRLRLKGGRDHAGDPLSISAEASGAEIALPGHELIIAGIGASVASLPVPTLTLRAAEVRHQAKPPQVVPLRLSGKATMEGGRIAFAGRAADVSGRLVATVSGMHSPDAGRGSAMVKLHPLSFVPDAVQPQQLFPALGRKVSAATGTVAVDGPVAWSTGRLSSDIRVTLKDLSFSIEGVLVEGLNAAVAFDSPWPPSTRPDQTVTVKRIVAGVPLIDGAATYRLDPSGRLLLERGAFRVFGGKIEAGPLAVDPAVMALDTVLKVNDVDMAEILTFADVDGVSGTGRLSGQVPVIYKDGALSVHQGAIVAEGPGVLRYAPEVPPPALQGGDERISLMLGALKNFHYETLRLDLDRAADGEWSTRLHLAGRNPIFKEGQPFEFNLNLSGALDAIARKSLESYRHPERLGAEPRPAGR